MPKYSTLTSLFSAIANSLRSKTGSSKKIVADDFPSVIDSISVGVEGGIIPSGTKSITSNGTHDVTSYASASVNVPTGITPSGTKSITTNGTHDVTNYASASVNVPVPSGYIKPSGTKEITANGTHDITNYASANVNVAGLNARIYTVTLNADKTSGNATLVANDSYLASIASNPNAFVFMRCLSYPPSTQMLQFWFSSNFPIGYGGTTAKYDILGRAAATAMNFVQGAGLGVTSNYNGQLKLNSSGTLQVYCNATYPLKAGQYQIIAGIAEMI